MNNVGLTYQDVGITIYKNGKENQKNAIQDFCLKNEDSLFKKSKLFSEVQKLTFYDDDWSLVDLKFSEKVGDYSCSFEVNKIINSYFETLKKGLNRFHFCTLLERTAYETNHLKDNENFEDFMSDVGRSLFYLGVCVEKSKYDLDLIKFIFESELNIYKGMNILKEIAQNGLLDPLQFRGEKKEISILCDTFDFYFREEIKELEKNFVKYLRMFFAEPWNSSIKIYGLPFMFNLRDELGGEIEISPFMEDINGWFLKGSKGVLRGNLFERVKDDIESYLGTPVLINAKNGGVFITLRKVVVHSEIFKKTKLFTKNDFLRGNIFYGYDSSMCLQGRNINDDKHLLIVGESGSGKSYLQHFLVEQLYFNIEFIEFIYLCDLKGGVEFFKYGKREKTKFADDFFTFASLVEDLNKVIKERLIFMRENGLTSFEGKKIYLVVDEFSDIFDEPVYTKEDKETQKKLFGGLSKLSKQGRAVGIRLICGLQRATTDSIGAGFKKNFHDRIMMKQSNPTAFTEVFGYPKGDLLEEERDSLPLVQKLSTGEFIASIDGHGTPIFGKCPKCEFINK